MKSQKSGISGLPGFWIDKNGKSRLWLDKDYSNPLLLIPYLDAGGNSGLPNQIFWQDWKRLSSVCLFSTLDKSCGVSSGSPLHFVSFLPILSNKPVLITEGALKAATVQYFKSDFDVVANAGVTCSHDEIVKMGRFRRLFIAFDTAYYQNHYVAKTLAKLIHLILLDSRKIGYNARVSVVFWKPEFKSIDDALLSNVPISFLSLAQWFNSLSLLIQNWISAYF